MTRTEDEMAHDETAALTMADDHFHPPTTKEPTWAETAWFAASRPEDGLWFWFYPLFRPQLGVLSVAVYAFGSGHHEPWELEYYRPYWHMPIGDGVHGPCDFTLPNGLRYETLEPMSRYRIRYEDGDDFRADLAFEGIHAAHPLGVERGRGHLDQLGRVTGEVVLHGRRLEIDCVEMRDRTWSPRREGRQRTELSYSYGVASDGSAFHVSSKVMSDGRRVPLTGFGLGLLTGFAAPTRVKRRVRRDERGRPLAIVLDVTGPQGPVRVEGRVRSQMTLFTSPYVAFISGVEWTLEDGTRCDGEDQDTWSPGRLRTRLRSGEFT